MPAPDIRSAPQMKAWRETYPDDQFLMEMRDRLTDAVPVNNACGRYVAVVPVGRAEFQRLLLIIQELQNPLLPSCRCATIPEDAFVDQPLPKPPEPGLQGGAIGMEDTTVEPRPRTLHYAKDLPPAALRADVRAFVEAGHLQPSLIAHPNRDESVRLTLDKYDLIISIRDILLAAGDLIAEKAGG